LLRHPLGHRDVEMRVGQGHRAGARARQIELGPGDESRVRQEVVQVARDVRNPGHAALEDSPDRAERVDPRQRQSLHHHVARERTASTDRGRPQHGPPRARPPVGRRLELVEDEGGHVHVGPGDAVLPVVPFERDIGVSLGKSLAVQQDVGQVSLRGDVDVAAAAGVLGAAERDVHVAARRHFPVEPVEAWILLETEHRQEVAQPERAARSDGVDDEAARPSEP
jgi:hypothetical protein